MEFNLSIIVICFAAKLIKKFQLISNDFFFCSHKFQCIQVQKVDRRFNVSIESMLSPTYSIGLNMFRYLSLIKKKANEVKLNSGTFVLTVQYGTMAYTFSFEEISTKTISGQNDLFFEWYENKILKTFNSVKTISTFSLSSWIENHWKLWAIWKMINDHLGTRAPFSIEPFIYHFIIWWRISFHRMPRHINKSWKSHAYSGKWSAQNESQQKN